MSTLHVYTDGACRGNGKADAVGGWGVFITNDVKDIIAEKFGGEVGTTNNRMELTAVLQAIQLVKCAVDEGTPVTLYTDSNYVCKGINEWMAGWKRKKWDGVKNVDLWKEMDELSKYTKQINIKWIKGHAGHEGNEKADELANKGCDNPTLKQEVSELPDMTNYDKDNRFISAIQAVYSVSETDARRIMDTYKQGIIKNPTHLSHQIYLKIYGEHN